VISLPRVVSTVGPQRLKPVPFCLVLSGAAEAVPFPGLLFASDGELGRGVQCVDSVLDFFVDF
jgi:hypothetical protein